MLPSALVQSSGVMTCMLVDSSEIHQSTSMTEVSCNNETDKAEQSESKFFLN